VTEDQHDRADVWRGHGKKSLGVRWLRTQQTVCLPRCFLYQIGVGSQFRHGDENYRQMVELTTTAWHVNHLANAPQ